MFWIWIIVTLFIFTFIVLVHEWWHFLAARFFSVKVEEFWLGIPPRATKLFYDKKWTLFSLNWLPIWGFVRLKWESEWQIQVFSKNWKLLSFSEIKKRLHSDEEFYYKDWELVWFAERKTIEKAVLENEQKDNLFQKPYLQQSVIILAGVIMNFLLAWIIFSLLFLFWVKPIWINTVLQTNVVSLLIPTEEQAIQSWVLAKREGLILSPVENSYASQAGIQENDIVLQVWGDRVTSLDWFRSKLQLLASKKITLSLLRWDKMIQILVQVWNDGKIGSYISENITYNKDFQYKASIFQSLVYGGREVYAQSVLTLEWLQYVFKKIFFPVKVWDREEAIKSMSWPIGVTQVVTEGLSLGFSFLCIIAALISVNLGVFNLLPIPALDWGRFLFICIHSLCSIFWKKRWFSLSIENSIHIFFFVLLIAMSIFIGYNDVIKLMH